jgi:hypothetical protein
MLANIVFWFGLVVTLVIGFLYFRDLGDVSQMLASHEHRNPRT